MTELFEMPHLYYYFLHFSCYLPYLRLPACFTLMSIHCPHRFPRASMERLVHLSATPTVPGFPMCARTLLVTRTFKSEILIPDCILELPWEILNDPDFSNPDLLISLVGHRPMHKHCFDTFKKLPMILTFSQFQTHCTNFGLCLKTIVSECVIHRLLASSETINEKVNIQVLSPTY